MVERAVEYFNGRHLAATGLAGATCFAEVEFADSSESTSCILSARLVQLSESQALLACGTETKALPVPGRRSG